MGNTGKESEKRTVFKFSSSDCRNMTIENKAEIMYLWRVEKKTIKQIAGLTDRNMDWLKDLIPILEHDKEWCNALIKKHQEKDTESKKDSPRTVTKQKAPRKQRRVRKAEAKVDSNRSDTQSKPRRRKQAKNTDLEKLRRYQKVGA